MYNLFLRWLLVASLLAGGTSQVKACDICGCGAGGVFLGMMPQYKKYFAGVRYQYRKYHSHLGSATGLLRTQEAFHTAEWYGGMRISTKTQVMAFVPYQWHRQQSREQKVALNGMGDVSLMGTTQIWESIKVTESNKLKTHTLHAGAGLKLPTGRWQFEDEGALGQHANFMPGTGSVDVNLLAMYQYNQGNTGIAASAMYRINTANAQKHRFGNRAQLAAQAFYKIKTAPDQRFTPNAGLLLEGFGKDINHQQKVQQSGGWAVNGMLGCEYAFAGIAAGMVVQPPVAQHISEGEVKNTTRGIVYFTFIL